MFLLVPAHPGFPGQIPQSRKTVVCCVCSVLVLCIRSLSWLLVSFLPHDKYIYCFVPYLPRAEIQNTESVLYGRRKFHTCQSQSEEQDARFPLQCRSPDNRCVSSNHVPKISYGLLRNLRRNVKFAVNKHLQASNNYSSNVTVITSLS